MKRALIVGEAGADPWRSGPSSKRLWYWFGCSSYDELRELADLDNVSRVKDLYYADQDAMPFERWRDLWEEYRTHEYVFCVGRSAQTFFLGHHLRRELSRIDFLWTTTRRMFVGKKTFVGLPHPSGLNRQLNGPDGNDPVVKFVRGFLTKEGLR